MVNEFFNLWSLVNKNHLDVRVTRDMICLVPVRVELGRQQFASKYVGDIWKDYILIGPAADASVMMTLLCPKKNFQRNGHRCKSQTRWLVILFVLQNSQTSQTITWDLKKCTALNKIWKLD